MTVESVNPETRAPAAPGAPELREPPVAGGGVPLLGHGWRLARDPLAFMSQLRDHGDVVRIKLGPKTVYAVTNPELTGALALNPDYHIAGPLWESLEGLLGKEGVATANGPLHRRQRRTIQPAFRLDAIPAYGPIMEEEAHALTERWQPGKTVDATSESFRVAVRVAARCLLRGQYMDERAERLCVALATVFRGMYRRMVVPLGPLYRLPLPANRRFNDALADLHLLVDEIIAERRASGQKPDDLLTHCWRRRTTMATRSGNRRSTTRWSRYSPRAVKPSRPRSCGCSRHLPTIRNMPTAYATKSKRSPADVPWHSRTSGSSGTPAMSSWRPCVCVPPYGY